MSASNSVSAVAVVLLAALLGACRPMSLHVEDSSAGPNGGFEHFRSDLPVNWLVHAPSTVPEADFDVGPDEDEAVEGERCLRFRVRASTAEGGWRSPGIARELDLPPGTYEVSFRVRSEGCTWVASCGGVSAKTGDMLRVTSSEVPGEGWQRVSRTVALDPRHERLRFELNVLSPGTLWIDDVRTEPLGDE